MTATDPDALAPQLDDTDWVHFADTHRPKMEVGRYTVTLEQTLAAQKFHASRELELLVQGPRYALPDAAVANRFPPRGATGSFERVLPHLALARPTLPWDRSARRTASPEDDPPWMALLVLTEAELAGIGRNVRAGTLETPAPGWTPLRPDAGADPDQPVALLDLPGDLARAILPTGTELELLTSARDVRSADGAVKQAGRAIVTANRLPPAGARCEAHLVSVEHQYLPDAGGALVHWSAVDPQPPVRVTLVSLAHWAFTAVEGHGDLEAKLQAIDLREPALAVTGLGQALPQVAAGAVPLRHVTADGAARPVWYHGPLKVAGAQDGGLAADALPARRTRALLQLDPSTGLTDISYAAAWELGRLLALRDTGVGVALHDWKRARAHAAHHAVQAEAVPELSTAPAAPPPFPLGDWFAGALGKLEEVPFAYLVPDARLLPANSMSFLGVDRDWIRALMDGAFSIGRTSRSEMTADRALRDEGVLPEPVAMGAILLRSAVVTDWPDLVFDAFDGATPRPPLRHARLGHDTLLILYDGPVDRLEVHLHPQAIHFGVDHLRRDAAGRLTGYDKGGATHGLRDPARGVLDLAALAQVLSPGAGAGGFAMEMIEPVPKVAFLRQVPA